jgi:hypothetical protein
MPVLFLHLRGNFDFNYSQKINFIYETVFTPGYSSFFCVSGFC